MPKTTSTPNDKTKNGKIFKRCLGCQHQMYFDAENTCRIFLKNIYDVNFKTCSGFKSNDQQN